MKTLIYYTGTVPSASIDQFLLLETRVHTGSFGSQLFAYEGGALPYNFVLLKDNTNTAPLLSSLKDTLPYLEYMDMLAEITTSYLVRTTEINPPLLMNQGFSIMRGTNIPAHKLEDFTAMLQQLFQGPAL